jgi:hypothetical protein
MLTGGCVCGAVRYRTKAAPELQGFCHCRNCQRFSGSGHVGFICVPYKTVTIEGETQVYRRPGGSGLTAERHFCPICCSALFGVTEMTPDKMNIYAGSLDDPSRFTPQIAIFTRSRPAWDDASRDLVCYETVPTR